MSNSSEVSFGHRTPRTAYRLALRLGPGHAQLYPFPDAFSFKFSDGPKDVQL